VQFPGTQRDIVTLGYVKDVHPENGRQKVLVELATNLPGAPEAVEREIHQVLKRQGVPYELQVNVRQMGGGPEGTPLGHGGPQAPPKDPLEKIRTKIAVASAKGGVGKSTVAVNLAVGLAHLGVKVGLLDADIHGPSIPLMLGIQGQRPEVEDNMIVPLDVFGVKTISIGVLIEADTAVIWRGPMVGKALEQLMSQVKWEGVDVLLMDLPPGTGDIQITLSQQTALDGGMVVTTPQDVALLDANRGVNMFQKVNVPVLGIVENMSTFVCPHCGEETPIFGSGGGRRVAGRLGVPLLAQIPIDAKVTSGGDTGHPIVAAEPESPAGRAFLELAEQTRKQIS
ncbi:MAG: P-loop NTPase, partial [Candidatus Eisenbacteria bacterium]|nr:P-loop NTPase [Candidatus Eisenbacteria bacterium]